MFTFTFLYIYDLIIIIFMDDRPVVVVVSFQAINKKHEQIIVCDTGLFCYCYLKFHAEIIILMHSSDETGRIWVYVLYAKIDIYILRHIC